MQRDATHNNFEYRLDGSLGKSWYLAYTNINQRLTVRSMLQILIICKITRFTFIAVEQRGTDAVKWKRQEFVIYSKSRRARASAILCASNLELRRVFG